MIEYLAPASTSGLQINYLETDLQGSDFTKLNSNPLTIVPAVPDQYIIPICFQIFHNINILDPNGIMIGDLATLQTFGNYPYSYFYFQAALYNLQGPGVLNVGLPNDTTSIPPGANNQFNCSIASPVSLWAITDSGINNIASLKIRTFYYILPQ